MSNMTHQVLGSLGLGSGQATQISEKVIRDIDTQQDLSKLTCL